MSYAQQILTQIANDMGRPVSSVQQFIQILEENWFDTIEALENATDQDYEKMKIPLRIVSLIREKVKGGSQSVPQKAQQQPIQQQQQTQDKSQSQMQQQQQQPIVSPDEQITEDLKLQLQIIRTQIPDDQQYLKTVRTVSKIIQNVAENPLNQQFYSIKLQSKTLQNDVMLYQSAWDLLRKVGWEIQGDQIVLAHSDTTKLNQACFYLKKVLEKYDQPKFDPYKAHFSATTGQGRDQPLTNADVAHKMGYDIYSFTEQLEILKRKRYVQNPLQAQEIMSQPIKDRDVKVFKGEPQQSVSEIFQQLSNQGDYEEVQPSSDPLLKDYLKKIAASLEEEKFASKRKKEFEQLFRSPVYSETIIRIKMPQNYILEAKFSPLELIKDVVQFVRESLIDPAIPFYIYTTPPVVKMIPAKHYQSTLDEMECVPSGLFYFSFENPNDEKNYSQFLRSDLLNRVNQNK